MFKNNSSKKETHYGNLPFNTVIANDISLKGNIDGDGAIRIDGNVEGNIHLAKGIVLGEKAVIKGVIKSDIIVIYGKITGDIECRELQLKDSGFIEGDIVVEQFTAENGGKHNGSMTMTTSSANKTTPETTRKEKIKTSKAHPVNSN